MLLCEPEVLLKAETETRAFMQMVEGSEMREKEGLERVKQKRRGSQSPGNMPHWFLWWTSEALSSQDLLMCHRGYTSECFLLREKGSDSLYHQSKRASKKVKCSHPSHDAACKNPQATNDRYIVLSGHTCENSLLQQCSEKKVSQMNMKQGTRDVLYTFQLGGTPLGHHLSFPSHWDLTPLSAAISTGTAYTIPLP